MNIKITEEQAHFILTNYKLKQYVVGSHLYGTNTEKSDVDYLIVYKSFHEKSDLYYPNYHQFQWDDVTNNHQYIFTSEKQFWKNLFSGDATIQVDVVLFSGDFPKETQLNICRTYNIIKAFIGFAKRDLKNYKAQKGKNKLFHIERGLYCAEMLINNQLPTLETIKQLNSQDFDFLVKKEAELRFLANQMFDNNELTLFPQKSIVEPLNELEQLLINANNIKEFRY